MLRHMTKKQKKICLRIGITAALVLLLWLLPGEGSRKDLGYLLPYLIIGYDILLKAWKGIRNGEAFDENFLMAVATVGAIALGEYPEGVAVMLFYQIGELFQSYAVGRSRASISELMDIRPDRAWLDRGEGDPEEADPEDVEIGSMILVRPGERIPLDGIVRTGKSAVDAAALTGESMPAAVQPGSEVLSGCINLNGVLRIETTRDYENSTASRILDLVENASSRKSRSEKFISRFAAVYTPAVCGLALALAILPPMVMLLQGQTPGWKDWIYRALTFLVISCPCALVISIPLTFFAGLGGSGREGILIKGSNYMETLSQVRHVVLDKTGTLTQGHFEVTDLVPAAGAGPALNGAELLERAAYAEAFFTHPIALSIRNAYGKEIAENRITDAVEDSGEGVMVRLDGRLLAAGNLRLMERILGPDAVPERPAVSGTVVYLAEEGDYLGYLVIEDRIKPEAAELAGKLRAAGVEHITMLTGDRLEAAAASAKKLGIEAYAAELLPGDKVAKLEEILAAAGKGKVAFVGDGINDAPVLARADVGIAMGAMGADAAIEAADVVLMDDDPGKLVKAIRIAGKVMRIVYENIYIAIGIKVLCLILGALGYAGMWLAIFADVGVMVLAVLNSIRALQVKRL